MISNLLDVERTITLLVLDNLQGCRAIIPPSTESSFSSARDEFHGKAAIPLAFQAVSASPTVVALAYPHDTNHQWVTIIYSVDIVYRATTLNNADRYHEWKMCATSARNLGDIAKEYLA